jgi:hypothetical protein
MRKRLIPTLVLAALALGVSPRGAFADETASPCSVRTLRGRYVFTADGFTVDPASGVVRPKAIVEVIDFNGDGTLLVPGGTRSLNGVITRFAPNPTVFAYTLGDDCAGTITFDGPTFDIFVAPRGNRLWLIQSNPNNVFQGSATRTSQER